MPLAYDDVPGSWWHGSKGWPEYVAPDETTAQVAYIFCTKGKAVPYGSYVLRGNVLRVETVEHLARVTEFMSCFLRIMNESPIMYGRIT